jgi:hypothetical protein
LSTLHVPDDPRKSADVAVAGVALDDRAHVVYRLYDAEHTLLYIGCTADIEGRMYALACGKAWFPAVEYLRVQRFPDRKTARAVETAAISNELPQHNGSHNPYYADRGDMDGDARWARRLQVGAEKPRTMQARVLGTMADYCAPSDGAELSGGTQ